MYILVHVLALFPSKLSWEQMAERSVQHIVKHDGNKRPVSFSLNDH